MLRTTDGWRRSGRCDTNACVEVAATCAGGVALRDSALPDGPHLRFDPRPWRSFVRGIGRGDFAAR
ncbi:DUF397 domain-containing protein [Solwaraspora sp. WMMB335]|uniref:DUF397 domain-containing protein n=1 Tax=Solwaraspora sp. WMMB335 TaxID=3404118 RepID=UPI003B942549